MESFRRHSWLKTLDDHREPSLYYLSTSDDKSGPHLICDWNGAPANFEEFEIDRINSSLNERTTWEKAPVSTRPHHHQPPPLPQHPSRLLNSCRPLGAEHRLIEELDEDSEGDMSPIQVPKYSCSHSVISEDDGSYFNLLTVPPMPAGLCNKLRLVAQRKSMTTSKQQQQQHQERCSPSKRANLKAKDYKADSMKKVGRSKKEKQ